MPTLNPRATDTLEGRDRMCSIPWGLADDVWPFFISVMECSAASGGEPEASRKLSMGVNIAALWKESRDESL